MNTENIAPNLTKQQNLQYEPSWNQVELAAITTGLSGIPVIGKILAGIVSAFWPHSQVDVWAEVKQQVEALVNQEIAKDNYQRVQDKLGSAEQNSGLIGVMNNYLNIVKQNENNPANLKTQMEQDWDSVNNIFTEAQAAFQQKDYELLLLPLFVPFANMYLTIYRDFLIQKIDGPTIEHLQWMIQDFGAWVDTYYQQGLLARQQNSNGDFNYVNTYMRYMHLNVLRFRETWKYFDIRAYPPPVKGLVFNDQAYFTITELLGYKAGNYTLPTDVPTGSITNIDVYCLNDTESGYYSVQGTQINYTNGQQGYSGVAQSQTDDYFEYFSQNVGVDPNNPIVSVQGYYNTTGGTYSTGFTFKNGQSTGLIPSEGTADEGYAYLYTITAPNGYYLSSIWVPERSGYYSMAADMVFGFRYIPVNID